MNGIERSWVVAAGLLLMVTACGDESSVEAPESPEPEVPVASSPPQPEIEPGPLAEPAPPPPSGHAVARVGALLFDASTGEVGFEVPPLSKEPTAPAGITVNVVGEKDGRLEVETLVAQPSEHHCAGTLGGLKDFRLRLYVSPDDLLPVVTEEVTQQFGDGTKLRVARGVTVPPGGTLVAGGTAVEVTVPEGSLGRYYEPSEPLSEKTEQDPLFSREGATLTYDGGKRLAEDSLYRRGEGLARFGTVNEAGGALVTVRNACLEVTAKTTNERANTKMAVPAAREFDPEKMAREAGIIGMMPAQKGHYLASPYGSAFAVGGDDEDVWGGLTGTEVGEAFGVGGLGLVGATKPTFSVKAGTAIVWADGKPAGQVTSDHTFATEPREQAGNSCFDVALTGEPTPTVVLCFAPGDVTRTEPAAVAGIGALGGVRSAGESGYGTGSGAGFGGRGKRVPRVRQAKAKVKGSLDKDIIRRIVRAHINEVRYCYNQGLARDPGLKGRVAIQFTIGPTGKVPVAVVQSTSLSDKDVANCIAKAVKRWKFPKPPGGGNAVVTYPFVLEPG